MSKINAGFLLGAVVINPNSGSIVDIMFNEDSKGGGMAFKLVADGY